MKDWEIKFINDMTALASDSEVFSRIVEFEFDGTVASANSPDSLIRNAMITRWHVYTDEVGGQQAWEQNLLNNEFYSAAFSRRSN